MQKSKDYQKTLLNIDNNVMKLRVKITISKYLPNSNEDINLLLSQVIDNLSEKTKKKFDNDIDIKCAILCELILEG